VFGYLPAEILGKKLEALLPERFQPAHPEQVRSFADGPDISRTMAHRRLVFGRRRDGTEFPAEVTISKLESGAETLLTAIVRDGTSRKQYEDKILKMNQELEERVRARTAELAERNLQLAQKNEENETFVYSVSHDLRSPLVNLEGFSDELLHGIREVESALQNDQVPESVRNEVRRLLQSDMRESVDYIRTAVSRLSGIIDALLRLSRAGRVVYQMQPLDIGVVVRRVVDALHATIAERRAEVVIAALPAAVGDATAVEQIFANLIGNALNYLDSSRPGHVEIGSCDDHPAPDGTIDPNRHTYFVKDNGLGIPTDHQRKLFQAFQRLHPNHAAGEGIGLAIIRRIVERLGGRIWVESETHKGATFYFTLQVSI
jgi:PAS domain S-box-containing protein